MMALSFTALKRSMFDCVSPLRRGLVSVAPKKTVPMIVVSQSAVPMRIRVMQNNTSLFTMFSLPFSLSL